MSAVTHGTEAEQYAVAEALWEDWRTCAIASDVYRSISWADLMAGTSNPVVQQFVDSALSQARVAIRTYVALQSTGGEKP